MVAAQDFVLGGLGAIAAILYFAVARMQSQRQVTGPSKGALKSFIIYWTGLGVVGLMGLALRFGPEINTLPISAIRFIIYLIFVVIFVAVGGLVHYLLFLYTGNPKVRNVAYGFYAFMFLFFVWLIEAHAPHMGMGHAGTPQEGEFAFHLHEEPAAWVSAAFSLGLILPLFGSAIAYALLFFRTDDRTSRYRIAMVSGGFVLWFTYSLFNSIAGIVTDSSEQSFGNEVLGQMLGVLAATLTLLAYDPPKRVRQWLGLRDLKERGLAGPGPLPPPRVSPL